MDTAFGSGPNPPSRWNAVRNFTIGAPGQRPGGLVHRLAEEVRFGLVLYKANAPDSPQQVQGTCPLLKTVLPTPLNNYAAMAADYADENTGDETPTGDTILQVAANLRQTPPDNNDPILFILARDGEPDGCANANPANATEQAAANTFTESAARTVFTKRNIRTYVVSVGSQTSAVHLQRLANAGLGRAANANPAAPYRTANDPTQLTTAIRDQIIANRIGCEFTLNGQIQDMAKACEGRVELNRSPLTCQDANEDWRATSPNTILLLGQACATIRADGNKRVNASFPCNVASLI